MGGDISILSGDIKHFRLPEVLQMVAFQRLTGKLMLINDEMSVEIYLRDGHVAFASGEKRGFREQLGNILFRMGRVKEEALNAALDRCAREGKRLGQVLAEEGLVTPDDIKSALYKQTERSTYRAMAWGEGLFYFKLCELPDFASDFPIALRVEDLILEGVRRIGESRFILEKIPSLEAVFKIVYQQNELDAVSLEVDERLVLGLVDGRKTVRELVSGSGLSQLGFLRALYALFCAGIVKKVETFSKTYRTNYL
ncbi:MAG: DUF4388 domain-containing protein [Nitrospirota bacterium]